jgi:hypothetical protein
VPNTRIYAEAYVRGTVLDERAWLRYTRAYHGLSRIDYLNYMAYMDGAHKYMFDEENLVALLRRVGFEQAKLRPFDPALDSEVRRFQSIYAEAKKPCRPCAPSERECHP